MLLCNQMHRKLSELNKKIYFCSSAKTLQYLLLKCTIDGRDQNIPDKHKDLSICIFLVYLTHLNHIINILQTLLPDLILL